MRKIPAKFEDVVSKPVGPVELSNRYEAEFAGLIVLF